MGSPAPTLLHISDLHRTSGPRLRNDELFEAIASDAGRWEAEGIPRPDLIVVSGDLIQGARSDASDPEGEIAAQYGEADDFLRRLATEFVDADLSRVVIVPGNHDVNRGRALAAMKPIACPDEIAREAFEADSGVRWDWENQQAFEIADLGMYDSRCEHFRQFRDGFYAGLNPSPLVHGQDVVFFEYPSLGLVVVGFASWHGNDCFCHLGEIDSSLVALSHELLRGSREPVALAVWHHSVVGGPRADDYMDQRVIHKLIDFGFSVGLHGHQHYPDAAPFELRLPNLTSLAVVGAGSLAVGDKGLPMGERRQFNVVVIDPDRESITVHVRAMSPAGVFAGSHRDDFGGNTYVSLPLPPSPARPAAPTVAQQLDDAMNAISTREYQTALELIADVGPTYDHQKRQVTIEALEGLGRQDELIALLDPPQNVEEVIKVVSLLLNAHKFDEAAEKLEANSARLDEALTRDLAATIKARRMAS